MEMSILCLVVQPGWPKSSSIEIHSFCGGWCCKDSKRFSYKLGLSVFQRLTVYLT